MVVVMVVVGSCTAQQLGAAPAPAPPLPLATQHTWAGINSYYLWTCNTTQRTHALDAVRAAGLRVVRVFVLSTTGTGAVSQSPQSHITIRYVVMLYYKW